MNLLQYIKKKGVGGTFKALKRKAEYYVIENSYPILAAVCPFPVKKNKVLLMNFNGKGYGADPKYICEELRKNKKYDLVWAVDDSASRSGIPSDVRTVRRRSAKYYYELLTARVWIDNVRKSRHLRKRRGQYYLQTWHGFVSLKKLEKDVEDSLNNKYILDAKNDSKMADLIPASSMDRVNLIKRAFWYDGTIAQTGCPRMDVLYNARGKKASIKKQLNMDLDAIYVVYAPTFRKSMKLDAYNIDLEMVKEQFEAKLNKPVKMIVRLHPNFRNVDINKTFGEEVIDGSKFDDGQLLFAASDIVISDYSDALFESALSGSAVFIYASDIKDYVDDRGFYLDYFSLPFPIAENNKQMERNILEFDRAESEKKINLFWDKLGLFENGTSSVSLAKWVDKKCGL